MLPIFTTTQVKDGIDSGDLMIDLSEYIKKKDAATKLELSSLTSVVANKLDAEPQHKHHIQDIKDLQEELQSKYDTSEKYSFNTIISDIDKIPYIEAPKIKMLEIAKDKNNESGYKFYVDEASGDLMICSDDILLANYTKSTNHWSFGGVSLDNIANNESVNTEISALKATDANTTEILENHTEALNAVCNATLRNINDIKNHTHTSFDNNLTVNGVLSVSDTMNVGKCQLQAQSDNYAAFNMNGVKWLSCNTDNDNMICYKNFCVAGTLIANDMNIASKITEMENILKNHYDALMVLCEKHGMVDSNTGDGSNVSPK